LRIDKVEPLLVPSRHNADLQQWLTARLQCDLNVDRWAATAIAAIASVRTVDTIATIPTGRRVVRIHRAHRAARSVDSVSAARPIGAA
jgi:hypothetical protein